MAREFLPNWLAALDAVVALERAQRFDHRVLLKDIADFLGHGDQLAAVSDATVHANVRIKRYVFELQCSQAGGSAVRSQLLLRALASNDLVIARRALMMLPETIASSERQSLIKAACCARFGSVRAEGLRMALASPTEATPSLALALCFDTSAAVRGTALNAMRGFGNLDVAIKAATERLNNPGAPSRSKQSAMHFLAAADPAKAAEFCELSLTSSSSVLRRVALSILLATCKENHREALLLRSLLDRSPRVQRVAVDCVHRGAPVPSESLVLDIAVKHGSASALSRAFSILSHSATWQRMDLLLQASAGSLPQGGLAICVDALAQWEVDARRNFSAPTITQRESVALRWANVAPDVPVALRGRIDFHLKCHGIRALAS